MIGARDLVHLLVRIPDGLEQPPSVARCAGIIGEVADHQSRHRDVARTCHSIAAGIVVTPLRQPTAKRAESCQADWRVVDDPRVTEVAGSGFAVIGVDGRIQPARISHGAVHDEAELLVAATGCRQFGELLLDPHGDSAVAVDLSLPVALEELGCVGRLVGVVRVVEIEFRIAPGGVGLVEDRGVEPLGERAVTADVCGEQHDAVGGDQPEGRQVGAVAGRTGSDGRELGLLLIEQR